MLKNAATTEKGKFFFLQFPLIHERLTSVFVKKMCSRSQTPVCKDVVDVWSL